MGTRNVSLCTVLVGFEDLRRALYGALADDLTPLFAGGAGLDFENAHEAMVRMAQQAQQQGAGAGGLGAAGGYPGRMPGFPGAPPGQPPSFPGMQQPGAEVYAGYAAAAPGQYAMAGMPPPRPY